MADIDPEIRVAADRLAFLKDNSDKFSLQKVVITID
jgi:hypothetical protein